MKFSLKLDKKTAIVIAVDAILAIVLFVLSRTVLAPYPNVITTLPIFGVVILSLPIIIVLYLKYQRKKDLEETFPVFLRDFVETVRSGMSIPQAFKTVANNDYKSLSPYVKKIAAQLDWGIPVSTVLLRFSKEAHSKVIGRIISSVVESHRFGGNLVDTFEALSNTAVEIERLRAERRLYLQSQMITGYIIFFVFLAVILGLQQFLVPSLTQVSPLGGLGGAVNQADLADEYKAVFRNLIVMQGLFAGLTVGKMAEGAMLAGIKHSIFMVMVGTIVFTLFG